jgi:endonuclease YncB( thermonuclease family)
MTTKPRLNQLRIVVPPAAVIEQPDGDTFHLFTFGVPSMIAIRVQGVDTPERPTKTKPSPNYQAAKDFTKAWLAKGPFTVTTTGVRSLERIVAIVERDGELLAQALIDAHLGVVR